MGTWICYCLIRNEEEEKDDTSKGGTPLQLKSLADVAANYQYIYLSPHFDDVVYSCGGTIGMQARSGQRPLVITVFAGVPPSALEISSFALKMHTVMGFGSDVQAVIAARRKEDADALEYLHADYLWLDY